MLFAPCFDGDIAEDLYLAGETHVWILFQVLTQPELLHECERIGIGGRRDGNTIGAAETIPMTIENFVQATIH